MLRGVLGGGEGGAYKWELLGRSKSANTFFVVLFIYGGGLG